MKRLNVEPFKGKPIDHQIPRHNRGPSEHSECMASDRMNAVAISALAERTFDPDEFPFPFLQAFGNKDTTIKRLRSSASNRSDWGVSCRRTIFI
jgi:hypothetical protein